MIVWSVVIVLIGGLGLVLFVPLVIDVRSEIGDDALWGSVEIRWGRGVAAVGLKSDSGLWASVLGVRVLRTSRFPGSNPGAKRGKRGALRTSTAKSVSRLARADLRTVHRMLAQAIAAVHPRLRIHGTLGLGDPSQTALVVTAARHLAAATKDRVRFEIHDDFISDTTQLFTRAQAWVIPAELLWMFSAWLARPDTRRILQG